MMDKQDTNRFLYQTAPPGPIPLEIQPDNASEKMVFRSRLTAIVTLIVNIVLIVLAAYVFIEFDVPRIAPGATIGFVGLVVFYAILSASIVIILNRTVNHSALQQEVLQSMIRNYQRRTDELQLAAHVARDATSGSNLDSILQQSVQLVFERFGFYHVGIYLVEEAQDGKYAVLKAAAGNTLGSRTLIENRHRLPVGGKGIIGNVTDRGRARVVIDVKDDAQHWKNPALPDTRSEMAVPLQVGDTIIGAFDVQSRKEGSFSQQDVMIMQTLADLLAVAIHKANLHQVIELHNQTLEQRVAARTQELAGERAQLNAILEAMTEGVIYYQDNRIKYINPAFTELMGYSRTDWEGVTLMMRVSKLTEGEVTKLRALMDEELQRNGMWEGDITMRRKDGSEFEAHVTATDLHPQRGEDSGTVIIIRDVSQERALQEQKARFVSYASHELRTPLTNLKTRLYLLKKQPQFLDKHHDVILEVTERMQRLIEDLLAKSRFDRGEIELNRKVTALNELLRDVVDLQQHEAEKKAIAIILNMPDKPLTASVDDDRITQVFTNLISNAINYTGENGKIAVTLREDSDSMAEIIIADTGIGIAPELLDNIFNPFVRADNSAVKGTGLGLNITKQIVDLHGGSISVKSEVNKGSAFTVRLKLLQRESVTG
jgi:PAS domain S-box-containing protein